MKWLFCRETLHLAALVLVGGHEDGVHDAGVYITVILYDTVASMYPGSGRIEIPTEPELAQPEVRSDHR